MLISFSVTNFRSIKEKQTIDMTVASKYHSALSAADKKKENGFFESGNKSAPELLKSVGIYGSNASGKSNFIRAVYIFNVVALCLDKNKKRARGELIAGYDPFIIDEKFHTKPTEFEIDFIAQNGVRYVYGFAYDNKQIHHEKLELYVNNTKNLIYEIKLNKENQFEETFSEHFQGNKDRALDIIRNTENNLFLHLNPNEDGNKFLNPIYDWIAHKLHFGSMNFPFGQLFEKTAKLITEGEDDKKYVIEILKKFDLGICDIDFSVIENQLPKDILQNETIPQEAKEAMSKQRIIKFKTSTGHYLNRSQLSLGTTNIFGLMGLIIPILQNGGVLFFDELETSLHPDVLIYLIRMFHDPKINKKNGQIIFTAHNDILLEKNYNLLRRDQIWFVSKADKSLATTLYSLVEFPSVKKRDNIVQRYRNYEFGARPVLKQIRW